MLSTRTEKLFLILFLFFFGITGYSFIKDCGTLSGLYLTVLTWSFFVLCLPTPRHATITSLILQKCTSRSTIHAGAIIWLAAILINIFTYAAIPYVYLASKTTFLLYRIISNPWPLWIIIGTSSLVGFYNFFLLDSYNMHLLRHKIAKLSLTVAALAIFFYLSYIELIVILYTQAR